MLEDGPRELVGVAGEAQGAPRVQAQWGAWVAGAGLLVEAGARTLAVVAEEADHSSMGVEAASPLEALQGGWVGPEASPS